MCVSDGNLMDVLEVLGIDLSLLGLVTSASQI